MIRPRVPRGVRLKRLPNYRGYKIYVVDGERIRGNGIYPAINIEFTMGANGYRYPRMTPKNELWLDVNLSTLDREATKKHEADESDDMSGGMKYVPAHMRSSVKERRFRRVHGRELCQEFQL